MAELALTIVTPRRQVLEAKAGWVDIPAESGWMRVLPGHAPTLGALGAGLVRFDGIGESRAVGAAGDNRAVVAGGFFEVRDDIVTLLANLAELPAEINQGAARAELERLQAAPPPAGGEEQAEAAKMGIDLARARTEAAG